MRVEGVKVESCGIGESVCWAYESLFSFSQKISDFLCSDFSWKQRAIELVDHWDVRLEEILPNFFLQTKIDELAGYIESYFAPLQGFNESLNSNGQGNWARQLATYLAKLPVRSARNILRSLYRVIQTILYTAVHPLKSINCLARNFILLIDALTEPEIWAQMGAGMAGACLGQSFGAGVPISVIGMGIGAAMIISGLSLAALRSYLKEQGMEKWLGQAAQLPETFLTGVITGLLMGAIQKYLKKEQGPQEKQELSDPILKRREEADRFVQANNLPAYSKLSSGVDGNRLLA